MRIPGTTSHRIFFKCLPVCARLCQREKEEMLLCIFMYLKGLVVSGTGSLALSREENTRRQSNHFYSLTSTRKRNFNVGPQKLHSAHLHTLPHRSMLQPTARATYAPFFKEPTDTTIKNLLSFTFTSVKFA